MIAVKTGGLERWSPPGLPFIACPVAAVRCVCHSRSHRLVAAPLHEAAHVQPQS